MALREARICEGPVLYIVLYLVLMIPQAGLMDLTLQLRASERWDR